MTLRAGLRLAAVLLLFSSVAMADPSLRADPARFAAQRAEIEQRMKDDGYSELTLTQREQVVAALDRMEAILASAGSIEQLDQKRRVKLYDDQELVNNLLTRARADSRTVCRQRLKTGSHRANAECRTVAEIRRERESSQDALRKHQRTKMRTGGR